MPAGNGPTFEGTDGFGINTAGVITGGYTDSSEAGHGFIRSAKGVITSFDAPGAGAGMLEGTVRLQPSTPPGLSPGRTCDANSVFHGFVRIPPAADHHHTHVVAESIYLRDRLVAL